METRSRLELSKYRFERADSKNTLALGDTNLEECWAEMEAK